jgi:DNA-binding winged helix-turn-helix (wHTH) protein
MGRSRYRFGGFTLSPARRSLRRDGREVPLIPRYLDLLVLLVERRAVALPRREIFDRVWSDVVVSDGALSQAVRTLRRTLGSDDCIRTVSRHGYQFVGRVVEEPDDLPEAEEPTEGPATPPAGDDAFARLVDPGATEEARRDAAEVLHALGTAEALRRLARTSGRQRALAWAHLRDSRWDVAGSGAVPLFAPPAGPAAWAALVRLRLRRALRTAGARWAAAAAGGALAGAVAGLLGGAAMAALGGSGAASLLLALAFVAAAVAGTGAAGVGFGIAAAEATVRSRRLASLAALGAIGGAVTGFAARHLALGLLDALFGLDTPAIGGGWEGLWLGAAAGFGFGLGTRGANGGAAAPRGRARVRAAATTAVACAVAGAAVAATGGRLGAASLEAIVERFPTSRVHLEALARPLGETRAAAPPVRTALGAGEGLLFGAGLAAGLTRRPRPRADDDHLNGR